MSEATFQTEVVDRSRQVPVVLDLWASWCAPCRQLTPILEKLATEAAGAWLLAKVDVDANPGIAQALGVQGIPAVKAIVGGQIVHEFVGALPEPEVRLWLAEVVAAAAQVLPPTAGVPEPATEEPPVPDPEVEARLAASAAEFAGLLDAVRAGEEGRDVARARLLELFTEFPEGDERVARARRELSSALF